MHTASLRAPNSTILLSVISMLNEPNTSSPANVDASVAFRKWKEGISSDYERRVRAEVANSKRQAEEDGVKIPLTMDEYIVQHKPPAPEYERMGSGGGGREEDETHERWRTSLWLLF